MIYYVKEGQSSIFNPIKLNENICEISTITSNIRKTEKTVKKMKKKKIDKVVLSKQIKEKQEFITLLNNYDITILDGKWLMQYILEDIIKYIKEKRKIEMIDEITILANDLTNEVKHNIKIFTKQYKKIRIVTNHLQKFKRLEKELYEEKGIPVIITNNKRKALSKAILIINFDFVQETVNQYNINEHAIIINLSDRIKINTKRFSGIIVTDYEVEFENNEPIFEMEGLNVEELVKKQEEFFLKEIIEESVYAKALKNNTFDTINNVIKQSNIKIKKLHGINGVIA